MTPAEKTSQTLQEAAPLIQGVDAVIQPEENRWDLGFNDGEIMSILLNEQARSLTFVSRIGIVPKENRTHALEALLLANRMWEHNGGVCMALDEKDVITQVIHVFADIDGPTLVAVIEDQREKSDAWRKALPEVGAQPAASGASEADQEDGFLRV